MTADAEVREKAEVSDSVESNTSHCSAEQITALMSLRTRKGNMPSCNVNAARRRKSPTDATEMKTGHVFKRVESSTLCKTRYLIGEAVTYLDACYCT